MVRDGTFTVSTISISHTPSHSLTDSPPAGPPRQRDADDGDDAEGAAGGAAGGTRDITDEGGDIDCGRAWVRADGLSKPEKTQSISVMRDIWIKSRQHKRLDLCYFKKVLQNA